VPLDRDSPLSIHRATRRRWVPAAKSSSTLPENLYGTTGSGGTGDCSNGGDPNYGCGTVYELSPSEGGWTEKVIYSFQGANDGYSPSGGLIFDATGNLYGVAQGGSGSKVVVYELSPSNGV